MPASLRRFHWGAAEPYLGLPPDDAPFATSPVTLLPVPYEATVSFMGGTRFGPRGLLHASRFLELYDHELDVEPYRVGVHTLPELMLSGAGPEIALHELSEVYAALLDEEKFVVLVGGEHSVSGPPILAHADRASHPLSVLQLDAHADLRAEYEGTPYSHACVMHRVRSRVHIVPVGIRSLTGEERALMRAEGIEPVFGHELESTGWVDRVLGSLRDDVYITIDVDYFDPAFMPATGTPEPGGGHWYPTLELLESVFRDKHVVGCDVVELAPIPGVVASDVLAAKLVYKLIAFFQRYQSGER
ncbi:MAG: agmatinase [Gemmatimonadota bacterium]|nr:agmatinase [Gemmatimonadota bacterium]